MTPNSLPPLNIEPALNPSVTEPAPSRPETSAALQVAAFTATRTVFNTLHRMVYPFLAVLARGVGVDLITMSYALTARSLVGAVGPFAAAFADRRGRKFGMLLGMALFTVGSAVVVFWPVFPALVISIILSTLGKYIFDPFMQAYLGDRVPYSRRGRTIAVTEFGWSLAFILGIPLVGFLIARSGWMAPFPLMAVLGVLIYVGLSWMLPKDKQPAAGNPTFSANFRTVLTFAPALAGLAVGLFASTANEVVNLIFGVWLEELVWSSDRCIGRRFCSDRALRTLWGGVGRCFRRPLGQTACHRPGVGCELPGCRSLVFPGAH